LDRRENLALYLSRRLVKPLPFRHGEMRGVPFGGAMGYMSTSTISLIYPFFSAILSLVHAHNRREFQRFRSKSFLRVKALTCQSMYPSLSFACLKNHETDECSIENLPWGSGKGRCLWRQGKTCPAQAVYALSNETGRPTREGGKPLPFQAWGDVTCIVCLENNFSRLTWATQHKKASGKPLFRHSQ
jgi:hypothetical protein